MTHVTRRLTAKNWDQLRAPTLGNRVFVIFQCSSNYLGGISARKPSIYLDILVLELLILHTHPFNGLFSGTTQVSWYHKGKTNLDFTEARDSEW